MTRVCIDINSVNNPGGGTHVSGMRSGEKSVFTFKALNLGKKTGRNENWL